MFLNGVFRGIQRSKYYWYLNDKCFDPWLFLKIWRLLSCRAFESTSSMTSKMHDRVVVKMRKDQMSDFQLADFTTCIVHYIDPANTDGITAVNIFLADNILHISPLCLVGEKVRIKHPPFCPIHHMTQSDRDGLPPEIKFRGIDCGAAILVESGDGKLLLTQRANHLRTFPGIWVPPGGHIDANETLSEAGLRELMEETVLNITPDMCCNNELNLLAMSESVFPPKLSLGQPKRHHAVICLHAKLLPDITAQSLNDQIKIDPAEVGAAAWFDLSHIKAITSVKEGEGHFKVNHDEQQLSNSYFRAFITNSTNQQERADLPFADLLTGAIDNKDHQGSISSATKFALQEWLCLCRR